MKNLNENIDNLTSLWKMAGTAFGQYTEQGNLNFVEVPCAQWPNRIWMNKSVDDEILKDLLGFMQGVNPASVISYWSNLDSASSMLFEKKGFQVKSEQIGMSLELKTKFEHLNRLTLKRINTGDEAKVWGTLYPQSFGYIISPETLISTKARIRYYMVLLEAEPIGTAITFDTDHVLGIHGMGIIPAYRKQGFAEEVVLRLLNLAIDEQKTLATLQASAIGKSIYKNIGFSEDFLMTNYIMSHCLK